MSLRLLGLVLFATLCLTGCATLEEVEATGPSSELGDEDLSNPAANEGDFALDKELCWQGIAPDAATEQATHDAYEQCMRAKGWTNFD